MAKKPAANSGAKTEPKIVEASGTASSTMSDASKPLAAAIETAMVQATQDCFDEGVTDPNEIRERKLAAREQVKADFAAQAEKAAS